MRSGRVRALAVLAAIVIASAWASGWHRSTWGARLATLGCAVVVLGAGALFQHRRVRRASASDVSAPPPAGSRVGVLAWVAVVVVAATWDVLGLLTPPDRHHLTLSAMELAYRPLHALVFACWLAVGWVLASEPMRRRGH